MAELCYQAGLRRAEVCDLKAKTILQARTEGRDPLTAVAIPVLGKGNKRNVPVPVWLLNALKRYAKGVRQRLVDLRLGYHKLEDHGVLFVLDANNRKHAGNPITRRSSTGISPRPRTGCSNGSPKSVTWLATNPRSASE